MALYGAVKTMALPDLFQWLKAAKKSGALTLVAGAEERTLHFREGCIQHYSSRDLRDNLAQLLVGFGLISEADVALAYREHRELKTPLPYLLINQGNLDVERAKAVLSDAARDIVLDLFLEEDGTFVFSDQEDLLELEELPFERVPLDLDMEEALLEGMRRMDEWSAVRAKLARDTMRLEIRDRAWFEQLEKPSREHLIFSCVDRRLTLGEICLELRASRYSIYRVLHHALQEQRIVIADQGKPEDPSEEQRDRVSSLVSQAHTMMSARQWDEAAALFEVICRITPDDQGARAGYRRAREEHAAELYQTLAPIFVPRLQVSRDKLKDFRLSSEELFVASRVNGEWDIGALVMVSPLGELATLKTLSKLLHIGVISLQ